MWALSTAISSVWQSGPDHDPVVRQGAEDGEVDLLVVERDHVAPRGQGPQVGLDQGGAQQHLGRDGAGRIVGALGQHGHREPEGACRFGGHSCQLPGSDEPDVVGAQVASLGDSGGPDTTGTLGEETRAPMAKPLRIGSLIDVDRSLPDTVAQLQRFAEAGLDHAFAVQIFGPDALTLLAAAGAQVPGIGLGTGVVPVYPRHPMMLAQQALTVQWATGNRLILGIGLSHQVVVEGMWGISFDKPARYMKEYLAALMPLLHGEKVNVAGERVTTHAFAPLEVRDVTAPPVLVAALGDTMLKLAGRVADGTVTWMTGISDHRVAHRARHPCRGGEGGAAGAADRRVPADLGHRGHRGGARAHQRGVRHLPEPAVVQGDVGQGGRGEPGRRGLRGRRGRGAGRRSRSWPRPAPPTSSPPSSGPARSGTARSPCSARSPVRADLRGRSALERRVLELVEVRLLVHQAHDPLDGAPGQRRVALGPAHQPDEDRPAVHHEGRHPEDAPFVDRLEVRTA